MADASLEATLTTLAADGATGALRAGRAGTVFLDRGRVCYVECAGTPGVEELLAASGRISAGGVKSTRQGATGDGGDTLVRRGVLTRGELQFCVLGATLDASFFLFGGSGAPKLRFRDGDRHWLGPHWFFDVSGLFRECRRRSARLDRAWASAELDNHPITPRRHVRARHVVLSALQWEIVLASDGVTPPAELARRIGRSAYSTLLAVRELAAAELLEPPEPAKPSEAPKPNEPPKPNEAGKPNEPPKSNEVPKPNDPPKPADPAQPAVPAAPREPAEPPGSGDSGPAVLPRRTNRPGNGGLVMSAGVPATSGDPTDVNLLIRLRDALEALQ
ncbi:hypothetical protein [Acrocarpospora catenulata]|uniref:hypothetical protein n=1 Tax=Acrocarpospora catenulata TaxID=2836182 RepID=UPI001BDA99AA|nr:hypothetical protein [Acrocarpospora catenulata]